MVPRPIRLTNRPERPKCPYVISSLMARAYVTPTQHAAKAALAPVVMTLALQLTRSGIALPEQPFVPVRIVDDLAGGVDPHRGTVFPRVGRPSRHVRRSRVTVAGEACPQFAHVPRGRQPSGRLIRVEEEIEVLVGVGKLEVDVGGVRR